MITRRLLLTGLVLAVAGCAALGRSTPDPELRLQLGLAALAENDVAGARPHLDWVYRNYPAQAPGHQALLALIAAELDPRNPDRSLWTSADLAAQLIGAAGAPAWSRPVANTLYLVALELGASEERAAAAQQKVDMPRFDGPSLAAQMRELEEERDAQKRRADAQAQQIEQLEKEIREKNAEIERIRRTIRG
jgi:hypothetical protein